MMREQACRQPETFRLGWWCVNNYPPVDNKRQIMEVIIYLVVLVLYIFQE
jgi:hypothetical protein